MKNFGIFSDNAKKTKKTSSEQPEGQIWSPYEDQPLSLTAPQLGETVRGQRALVLGFAALAVIGGGYFAALAMSHGGLLSGLTVSPSQASVVTTPLVRKSTQAAPVAPTEIASTEKADKPALKIDPIAEMGESENVAETETVGAITASAAAENPLTPKPVKVQRIAAPRKPGNASATASAELAALPEQSDDRWARSVTVGANPLSSKPLEHGNAFAGSEEEAAPSVAAVEREAKPQAEKIEKVAALKPEKPIRLKNVPEMAGNAALPGRSARIRSAVKLRSGPGDETGVLTVIPGNTMVSVASGCRHWCRVSFNGRNGYVYKNFLR